MPLREAVVAVTYRCNSRCEMCNIWKIEEHVEMPPAEYRKLPRTMHTVNISGGEPFLRPDLHAVVRAIHQTRPNARLVFSTNGFLTDRIVSGLAEIRKFHPKLGVGVSIDGMEATHDRIRGINGMHSKAMETVRRLKESGISDLRLVMTILPENASEAESVFRLANELGVEFTATVAHNSDIYFRKDDNAGTIGSNHLDQALLPIIRSHLRSRRMKDWYRAYHMAGLCSPDIRRNFVTKCEAGRRYVFIAPNGDVFPCNVLDEKMFNVTEVKSWDEGATEKVMDKALETVRGCRKDCWMVCNTRSLIIAHPLLASSWVVRNKIGAYK